MHMKKILPKKLFALLLAAAMLLPLIPSTVLANGAGGSHLILLQTYGGGKNQSETPVSHSFIEVYNPTDAPVDLNGWKIVYHDEREPAAHVDWEVTLSAVALELPSRASFLIRGQALTSLIAPAHMIDIYDLDMPGNWLDNKTYSVKLVNPQGDAVNEITEPSVPNKHTALRRVNFASEGYALIDYRSYAALADVLPRSMADGAWGELGAGPVTPVDLNSPVVINQVYGRLTDGAVSHGFIELYNCSAEPMALNTFSLQYAENGTVWQKLNLSGTIAPYHSYLVRCLPGNADGNHRYEIANCDMDWNILISNRSLKIALVSNQTLLTVKTPGIANGVLDLVGAYNSASDPWDCAAGTPVGGMTKQKSVRRVLFANTGSNADDFEVIDYRAEPIGISGETLAKIRPHWSGDGDWGSPYDETITGLEELWFDAGARSAESFSGGRIGTGMVRWQKIQDEYHLIVPSSADISALKVYFKAGGPVTVNGTPLVYGQATNAFAAGGTFTLCSGGQDYTLKVEQTSRIATMFISTQSGDLTYIHKSQSNREPGKLLLVDENGNVSYNGGLERMNGRGNYTWQFAKKPYTIKLDKSASLLGMIRAKKWTLLANHLDRSFVRPRIMHGLALEAGIDFTSQLKPVDMYINNEYKGLYFLVEKVEVGDRVDITDLTSATEKVNGGADLSTFPRVGPNSFIPNTCKYYDIPNDPADITGGYLLGFELSTRYSHDPSGFVTSRGQAFVIMSPEDASKRQVEYIRNFVQEMEDAIYSVTGYNSKGKHYTDYIDDESFAKMYVLQEFALNLDAGITSCYAYKDSDTAGDGKIHAAPPWDFDYCLGNAGVRDNVNLRDPNVWWANKGRLYEDPDWTPHIFSALYKHIEFVEKSIDQWKNVYVPLVAKLVDPGNLAPGQPLRYAGAYADVTGISAKLDVNLWGYQTDQYATTDFVIDFIKARTNFLNREWATLPALSITWPSAAAVEYGKALSDSALTGGSTQYGSFVWTAPSTEPTVDNNGYSVTFTPNAAAAQKYGLTPETKTIAITVNVPEPEPKPEPTPKPKIKLWGKITKYEKNFLNWFLCIVCFGWIWMWF